LTGRRALVTGASRGIGLAVAAALAQRGASVAITGRKLENLTAAVAHLQSAGADVHPFVCHQGNPEAISQLFSQLDQATFIPNIVVINAATNPVYGPLLDLDLDAWRKILDVNLTGALLTVQAAARRMVSQDRGSIVFMASIAGIDPLTGLGAYSVSKAGLLGLMRALAKELGPNGIRGSSKRASRWHSFRIKRNTSGSSDKRRWAATVNRTTSAAQSCSWRRTRRRT
jgi:NAD(P)-dependent dehydrogenase (short-subunit alcohol dehydrogenase family)